MNSDLAALHKILKDETRRKIISLLDEKDSLAYTDLMAATDVVSTGTFNYHLKILGNLLEKNEAGQYVLSEKGKLASRLLKEFPEPDYSLQAKKTWWRRFWVAAVILDAAGLILVVALNVLGYLDVTGTARGLFGFIAAIAFTYFFYRMIRPVTRTVNPTYKLTADQGRTIKDIFVFGRTLQEVSAQIRDWIAQEGITVEAQHEDFFRGRLGIPSGLGLTAPKYFEVSCTPEENGVKVHSEGWISVYDVSEQSFSSNPWVMGSIPRRKGWKVMEHLWTMLEETSKQ